MDPSSPSANFPLGRMLARIARHVARFPPAAMFGLAAAGYDSLYEQLVSCVLSIRTYDETSYPASVTLLGLARTPGDMLALGRPRILEAIAACTYPGQKADTILGFSQEIVERYGGQTPADFAALTSFRGVGPKCANLALGVALGAPAISVDVHVERVVNRWGLVAAKGPDRTRIALEQVVPRARWVDINRLLMPFGKHTCTTRAPRCRVCPVAEWCQWPDKPADAGQDSEIAPG